MTLTAVDVMGFAGSFAAGVDQAGFDVIAKREPAKFGGFGVESMTYNMPWVEAQVAAPEAWDLPAGSPELAFGCPPCSGFSALSIINTAVHGTTYGIDDPINECMVWWADYVARVKPRIAIMESVALAYRNGLPWLEGIWERLVQRSGVPYKLTHVIMNAALTGGDAIRPRYFLVAHQDPFGVGLEFVRPRPMLEVIGDLLDTDEEDTDWGHMTEGGSGVARTGRTIEWLEEQGLQWLPGTRLPDNLPPDLVNNPPDFWKKPRPTRSKRYGDADGLSDTYSHWFSTDAFSPVRWRPDKPFGVVVAATLFRAVHPTRARTLTYREAARFMSIPDTWSLRVLVEKKKADELGKAVPTASGKWIAHWARMSVEGTPGEYAGRDTSNPDIRVIDVRSEVLVQQILKGHPADAFWPETTDPSPSAWLVDRKQRPREWWQREDELGIFVPKEPSREPRSRAARATPVARPARVDATIERVPPEVVASLLEELRLSPAEAAARMGVSVSRVRELTTDARPKSWLNAARWEEVQAALRG